MLVATALAVQAAETNDMDQRAAMRPNLLFAMADQLRWDAQGYANPEQRGKSVLTPALDQIAAEGVSIRFSWSSTPTCTPARAALLTGRRPWGHGMLGYGNFAL